jgi:hypothetical protein
MALIDLRNQINNSIHELVMSYNEHEVNYGIDGIPMVIFDGNIYKAKLPSVAAGLDPTNKNAWQTLSGFASVDKNIKRVNANVDIKAGDAGTFYVVNSTFAPLHFTLPKIEDLGDDGFSIGFSVKGNNNLSITSDLANYIANDLTTLIIKDGEKYELLADTVSNAWVITMSEVRNLPDNGSYALGLMDRDGHLIIDILNMHNDTIDYTKFNMDLEDGNSSFLITEKVNLKQNEKLGRGITIWQ